MITETDKRKLDNFLDTLLETIIVAKAKNKEGNMADLAILLAGIAAPLVEMCGWQLGVSFQLKGDEDDRLCSTQSHS